MLAIVITLPFCRRPVALPVLFALCAKGGRSKPDLARDLLDVIAETFPTRTIHLVADSAYGVGHLAGLGANITITTRARRNAVFHHPAPAGTGKRGRPRLRGDRIGTEQGSWVDTLINRYGKTVTAQTTEITGLWYGTWRTAPCARTSVRSSTPASPVNAGSLTAHRRTVTAPSGRAINAGQEPMRESSRYLVGTSAVIGNLMS